MNSINKYLTIDEQIKNLRDKGLKFDSDKSLEEFKEYLLQYNYTILIKIYGFEEMYTIDGKYNNITSNDIRYLFDLDRNISVILWKYMKGIELHFNSAVGSVLTKEVTKLCGGPYLGLINNENFNKIFETAKEVYSQKAFFNKDKHKSDIKIMLYNDIYHNIRIANSYLDINKKNYDKEPMTIINSINTNIKNNYLQAHIEDFSYIQIQLLCTTWSLSSLLKIFKTLNKDIQNNIIKEVFKFINNKKHKPKIKYDDFVEIINILSLFRNRLAHNEKIIDYTFSIMSQDLSKNLEKIFIDKVNIEAENNKLSILIILIEEIRGMKRNKITDEIKRAIEFKKENSNNEVSDFVINLIYKYIGIRK